MLPPLLESFVKCQGRYSFSKTKKLIMKTSNIYWLCWQWKLDVRNVCSVSLEDFVSGFDNKLRDFFVGSMSVIILPLQFGYELAF